MRLLGTNSEKTFRHGIHPPEEKDRTRDKSIRRLSFAPHYIIPMSQHAGEPAVPIVSEGQEVVRGEPIAAPQGFVSVPMHAPVTGVVSKIGMARDMKGGQSKAIYIDQYGAASQDILYEARIDVDTMSPAAIIKAVQATGVVGLGGSAFPTHVKLAVPDTKHVDTVIVNGVECEPYLTTDHRVMIEMPNDILYGLKTVMRALDASEAIIGIESGKPEAYDALRKLIPAQSPIRVEMIDAKYPMGSEKVLAKALLGRETPSGGYPIDVGVAVFNVSTLAQIGEMLPRQQGLIERVVTVSGPAITNPGNYLIPLGTPIRFVLEQVGLATDHCQIILGGPMMGTSISSLDVPVTKGVTGILAFPANGRAKSKIYPCIKCGACMEACPMMLSPSNLALLSQRRRYAEMVEQYHLMDCIDCGCCSYVCPSNIPLVHHFRVAKQAVRETKATL